MKDMKGYYLIEIQIFALILYYFFIVLVSKSNFYTEINIR